MTEDAHQKPPVAPGEFASALAPSLIEASGERLSDLRYFSTDWQQGGAVTAYAKWRHDDGSIRDVVVKAPVGPVEHRFTSALGEMDAPTPRVPACGEELGPYDLAWLVIERIPGEPMSRNLQKKDLLDLADSTALFYQCTIERFGAPTKEPTPVDWSALLEKARQSVRDNSIPDEQRWKEALKSVAKSIDSVVAKWRARPMRFWRHGDLHPGNAMRRPEGSPWGKPCCVLIDLARVTPGHWVTDAVYLERIHWGKPELLHGLKPVKLLAKAMKKIGLDPGDDYNELANLRRLLTAACTPAFLDREGHPKHLAGALDALELSLTLI